MKPHITRGLLLGLTLLTASSLQANTISRQFSAAPFSGIDVSGKVNAQIHCNPARPLSLLVTSDVNTFPYISMDVKNGILYLTTNSDYKPTSDSRLLVQVNSCNVKQLTYTGSGSVDLRGNNIVLQSLIANGSGPVSAYWINSTDVSVNGNGSGQIFLAGVAGLLDVTLSNTTRLNAKSLRAKRGFINTRDQAEADVSLQCALNALATGSSTIYYYRDPNLVVNAYQKPPANVLRMTYLDPQHPPTPPRGC